MTWHEPIITSEYLGGSLNDLLALSQILANKINSSGIGEIVKVSTEYSIKDTAKLVLIIMAESFIPSSIEF